MNEETVSLYLDSELDRSELFGNLDGTLKILKSSFNIDIIQRGSELILKGREAEKALSVVTELVAILESGEKLDNQKVSYVINLKEQGLSYRENNINKDTVCFTHKGRPIKPKTIGQKAYVNSIRNKDVVFGIGPAGTGKTYLAVAMAINAFKNKEVQKIILARPAVEAGERLGFLPGDLQEKVDPYLRPLYDALYEILGRDAALRLKEKEAIEVVPLAYMRGRTLDNSFIILDEAQNTTKEQMKMFLTRMGPGSRTVVTGDITQVDLPKGKRSGLVEAAKILRNIDGIDFCYMREVDVVRHELVKRIIKAYDKFYRDHPSALNED
ncbi:MAG: PhoH family protein [Clostridiales bacterium]|nr:PhoH family protein [Clostridiales bacterium]